MIRESAKAGLDNLQIGHLRHFDNLSRRPVNDWSGMKGRSVGQDDFGGYRFQLSYMAYAAALAHIHRMPAAPGLFKPMFERLFEKLLLPEVWLYWHNVSRGGTIFNKHLSHTYKEEWDPVGRDNIMYSAYVQSLALLYNYLFDDDRYAQAGAITFKHWSYFWGGEPKVFEYDQYGLNEHIYWLMAENGFLGVACEPNCIFQICNQPAILGFRLHDLLTGGKRAGEVTRAYEAAWGEFGRVGENGHYHVMISQDTRIPRENKLKSPWVDAWNGALMNMWNREFVREHYPRQIAELVVDQPGGGLAVDPAPRPPAMGEAIINDDCDFGWVTVWTAEMGDAERLGRLLAHADRHMAPSWREGGLYYPRNDQVTDDKGNRTLMEPHTGNVLLGYARLNVPDGLWSLYNEPLDKARFSEPALTEVARNIDLSRAWYDREERTLHFRMRRTGHPGSGRVTIGRLSTLGDWTLRIGGIDVLQGRGSQILASDAKDAETRDDGISVVCPSEIWLDCTLEVR